MFRRVLSTYRAAFVGLPRDTWILSLVLLINRSGSMVLPFTTLYLTQVRGLSVADAGKLLGLWGVGATVGTYLGGWLCDRIGAVRTMQISLIVGGACYLVVGALREPWQIGIGILTLAFFVEAFRPAVMAEMNHRAAEEGRVRAFALLRLAANLGFGIGPVAGGLLARYADYGWLFVIDAATCWAASFVLHLKLAPQAADAVAESHDARRRSGSPWTDPPFLGLMMVVFGMSLAFFQVFSTLPLYLKQVYGLHEDAIGLAIGINAALIVAFEMVLSHWAERRRSHLALVGIGGVLICAGFALLPLGRSLPFAMLTISIWTFGEMLALPLSNAVVAGRPARASRGRYMGLYATTFSVSFVVAPVLGSWIYERFGPDRLWLAIGGLGLPILIGALALRRPFEGESGGR